MEGFYKNKYLKYKQKYLEGGECVNCPKIGFEQHYNECWHDSLSTILLFSDDFSESIQNILKPDFDAKMLIKIVQAKPDIYPTYFMPPNINESSGDFDKFIEYAKIYLTNLNKLYQNELKPIKERTDVKNISIACVSRIHDITNINKIQIKKYKRNEHRGDYTDNIINTCIYNYFLRTDEKSKYLVLNDFNLENSSSEELKSLLELLPKCFGIFIGLNSIENNSGHATGFFTCKNKQYFFDNNGISDDPANKKTFIEFRWKEYLIGKVKELIESKDKSYTIISDFTNTFGSKYLRNYLVKNLVLYVTHEITDANTYYKNNYKNFVELVKFSSPKLTSILSTYDTDEKTLNSLLFNCVRNNNHEVLKAIVTKNKIDVTKPRLDNESLLFCAVSSTDYLNETIKYLLQFKFDLNETIHDDIFNYNIFLKGVLMNNIEFISLLLTKNKSVININYVTKDNASGLFLAILENSPQMVELLLKNGIDYKIEKHTPHYNISPLKMAIQYNVYEENFNDIMEHKKITDIKILDEKIAQIESIPLSENKKIIQLLLNAGAGKTEKDILDIFIFALEYNNLEAISLILDPKYNLSINVNEVINFPIEYSTKAIENLNKKTYIYMAVKSKDEQRNEKIFDLLLQKRPNKKSIQYAIKLCKENEKPNLLKKLLAFKV